jgi:hypothetical protein
VRAARVAIRAAEKIRENKPFHRSSFGAFKPDPHDEYRRAGVDPDSKPNADVITGTSNVREFEGRHLNSTPNSDSEAIEPSSG